MDQASPRRGWSWALCALVAVLAGGCVAGGVALAVQFRFPAPFLDSLAVDLFLHRTFLASWSPLAALDFVDAEHRPALPLYLYALDYRYFDARGALSQGVSVALIAGIGALVTLLVRPGRDGAAAILWGLATAALLVWPGHWENLLWGKQAAIYAALFLSVAALALMGRAERPATAEAAPTPRLGLVVAAAVCGLGACLSFALALALWPTLIGWALARRWPARTLAPLVLGAAIGFGLGLAGAGTSEARLSAALTDPVAALTFAGAILGAPLQRLGVPTTPAMGVGLAGLIVTLAGAAWSGRRRLADVGVSGRFGLGLALFAVLGALLIALGRVEAGYELALSSRYLVVGTLWLLGLALCVAERTPSTLGLATTALLLATLVVTAGPQIRDMQRFDQRLRAGAAAAAVGARLRAGDETLHPDFTLLEEAFAAHRAQRKGIYAQAWPHWLGKRLDAVATIREEARCPGGPIGEPTRAPKVHRLQGTADGGGVRRSGRIVLTNGEGVVVGFGAAKRRAPDWALGADRLVGPQSWVGFIPRDVGPVQAWVLNMGQACRLS